MNNAALLTVSAERAETRQRPQLDMQPLQLAGRPHSQTNCWQAGTERTRVCPCGTTPAAELAGAPGEGRRVCASGSVRKYPFKPSQTAAAFLVVFFVFFLLAHPPLRCGIVWVRACGSPPRPPAPGSLRRAPVRISCPLDMNVSVSMPPINKRIDRLFDCLDNLCESQHNSSRSGFKDASYLSAASCEPRLRGNLPPRLV